jgi:phosphatidylglycerol:prolipoprotein diacylglycerol transferase
MTITLDPNALGASLLPWTTLMTVLGALAALAYLLHAAPALGISRGAVYRLTLRIALWPLLGARLFHVADYAGFYREVPFQAFYLWNGGLSLWGAVIVGSAGAAWHARGWRLPVGTFADKLVVAGLIAIVIGRFGDFLAGERVGNATSMPWSVSYANRGSESFGLGATHPVALYEMLLAGLLLAVIARWRKRVTPDGATFALTLSAYAVGRFLIATVTVAPTHLGLDQAHWVGMAVVIAVAVWGRKRISLRR